MVGALTNVSDDRRRAPAGRKIALHRYRSGHHAIDRVYQRQCETLLLNSLLDRLPRAACSLFIPAQYRLCAARCHARFHIHYTPTYSSWINLVERFFAALTEHQLRRGNFCSTQELERAIQAYLAQHNEHPKPIRWTKSADEILASIGRLVHRINRT